MSRASAERLATHVRVLSAAMRSGRHDPAGMDSARRYVTSHLSGAGWQVSQQPVSLSWRVGLADDVTPGGWWPIRLHRRLTGMNLLATRPTNPPGPPLIIGAHLDAVKDCPGADDNASSVAVLLELATLLSRAAAPATAVMLAVFDLEEVGHFGGRAAARHIAATTGAVGMVNLEMVGYYSDEPGSQHMRRDARRLITGEPAVLANLDGPARGDFLLVIHRRSSAFLAQQITDGASRAGLPVATLRDPRPEGPAARIASFLIPALSNLDRSDHAPFWKRRIPAVMCCDTAHLRNPNYHRPSDTPDTLDYPRMAAVTDAVAHLADTLAAPGVGAAGGGKP